MVGPLICNKNLITHLGSTGFELVAAVLSFSIGYLTDLRHGDG